MSIANKMLSIVSMISIDLGIEITYPDLISRVAMTSSDLGHMVRQKMISVVATTSSDLGI